MIKRVDFFEIIYFLFFIAMKKSNFIIHTQLVLIFSFEKFFKKGLACIASVGFEIQLFFNNMPYFADAKRF